MALPCLELLSETLVSEDLLLFEDFACETDFQLDEGLLVNEATLGLAIVHKELLVINENSFSLFNIAYKPT